MMKKIILCLLMILLVSCSKSRNDYFILGFDDYTIAAGYDNVKTLKTVFDIDCKQDLQASETIITNLDLFDNTIAEIELSNPNKSVINIEDAIISKIIIYLNDMENRTYSINNEILEESIKDNCSKFNGQYIEKNGKACLIENVVDDKNNYIIMYGDYLNIDQDKLDHIEIGIK